MIKHWKLYKSVKLNNYKVFSTRNNKCVSPKDNKIYDFYVIDAPDWINVVVLTIDNEFVLIKQFRHGTRDVEFEIPGGMVDYGEKPLETAKRELLEETGYISENWEEIGKVNPNPAIMSNSCYTFLAVDAKKVAEPEFDCNEDIETFLVNEKSVIDYLKSGKITHSLVVAAFHYYFLRKKE